MNTVDLDKPVTQAEFGAIVGIGQSAVSQMISSGLLPAGAPLGRMLLAYCERLREQAAGRMGESGGLDLVQERAALAREQRIAQRLKNDIARGEYAPIGLLADVLGIAGSAVAERFDQLEGALRKACPDLPDDARTTVMKVIASARNEWVRSTAKLVDEHLDAMVDTDDGEGDAPIDAEELSDA